MREIGTMTNPTRQTSTRYLPLRPEFWTTSRDWNQRIHLYNAFGAGQLANCDHGNAASLFDSVMQVIDPRPNQNSPSAVGRRP